MKKLLLISMLMGAVSLTTMAQDDDLYFVPKKSKAKTEKVTEKKSTPTETYYEGSDRSVDDYNRMLKSKVEVIDGDSAMTDVINFSATKGVYPDSTATEDYELTKKMMRFDDYQLSDNAAYWAGYRDGRDDWGWHSPWYYNRYGWYSPWFYSPYYYRYWYSWYDPWFDPWYGPYYGWGYPYYWGWGGYSWYGWYDRWYYPYYYGGGGGRAHYYSRTGNAGTIDRWGSTHGTASYGGRNRVTASGSRMGSLRDRAGYSGAYSSGNSQRSRSGNFSGRRGGTYSNSNSSYSGSRSSGSYSGSAGRSGGGSFSGGGGGSHSSGGGRSGGGSLGGRR